MLSYDSIISMADEMTTPDPTTTGSPSRDDVVAAAWDLVSTRGTAALSMRALATAVGTSYQVVYSRIGGKADVARALHDEGFARLVAAAQGAPGTDGTLERVVALAHGYLAFARANQPIFDIMFGRPIREFVRDEAAKQVQWAGFQSCFLGQARAWLGSPGEPASRRVALPLAYRLWTSVHGITVLHLAGHDSPSGDVGVELAEAVTQLCRAAGQDTS